MVRQRSLFDIVGPIMVGPSSSHTAGAVRLGLLARAVFGATPQNARIGLHGSFASTGHGHGTDLALVAGLLGLAPDDLAIKDAHSLAKNAGLSVEMAETDLGAVHPNSVAFGLAGTGRPDVHIEGASLGGGVVVLTRIGAHEVEVTGELPMLLVAHFDQPGEIAAVTSVLAGEGVNIARMRVSRERRGAAALMLIETDVQPSDTVLGLIAAAPGITGVRVVPTV